MRRRVFGADHPSSLVSMRNLAKSQGRRDDALALMEDCARRRKKRLGPDHPDAILHHLRPFGLEGGVCQRLDKSLAAMPRRRMSLGDRAGQHFVYVFAQAVHENGLERARVARALEGPRQE
ncbi:hypothetical protein LY76DRAFT_665397 [Colletotrichum caudatum]|nr:hypothetical protein LY76DRAFT_665397 [Colletotrichum caudatum]